MVFLLAAAWFALFQPWGSFADPDAFYHAKIASLLLANGPLHAFPWLDLTAFAHPFADQHFLFHVLLVPFVNMFGMFPGAQIAAIIFGAAFMACFDLVLRRLSVQHAWVWTLLVATSASMIVRLTLAKASPIALIWFVLGLYAAAKRKHWLALIAGAGFALSHGGWIILLVCLALFAAGEMIFLRFVEARSWREAIVPPSAWSFAAGVLGAILGTIVHPNFPGNVQFLWLQVVRIGLGTPMDRVTLGMEWFPPSVRDVLASLGPFLVITGFLVFGLLFAIRKPLDLARAKLAIAFALPVAGLLALTFKSFRAIEYLVPMLAIWLAALWSLVDAPKYRTEFRHAWAQTARPLGKRGGILLSGVLAALMVGLVFHDASWAWRELRVSARPFDDVAAALQPISRDASPGDRVFHSGWDFFPQLFATDDRLRYIVGLDPTFLLAADPDLSDAYRDLSLGRATSTAYGVIHDRFGSRFAIVDWRASPALAQTLASDARFVSLYDGPRYRSYRVD